jgi:Asp-tRNA(Asn)/Glu-tRNA(Gln) amidotransferase C subunit
MSIFSKRKIDTVDDIITSPESRLGRIIFKSESNIECKIQNNIISNIKNSNDDDNMSISSEKSYINGKDASNLNTKFKPSHLKRALGSLNFKSEELIDESGVRKNKHLKKLKKTDEIIETFKSLSLSSIYNFIEKPKENSVKEVNYMPVVSDWKKREDENFQREQKKEYTLRYDECNDFANSIIKKKPEERHKDFKNFIAKIVSPSSVQEQCLHEIEKSVLKLIYGEDFFLHENILKEKFHCQSKNFGQDLIIKMPRREGKTFIAMAAVIAALLSIPGITIMIISTFMNTSKLAFAVCKSFFNKFPEFETWIDKKTETELWIKNPNDKSDIRKIICMTAHNPDVS